MISRSMQLLGAISLYCAATSVSGAGEGGLRRVAQQKQEDLMCLLATLHTTYMGNDDNEVIHGEETTCTLVQDGIPTPLAYPIVLPNDFVAKHESNIERGRLLVSVSGASLIAGEYVLEDEDDASSERIAVIDDDFSPKITGRNLIETKDPKDAFGERKLIVFRVNGVAGEKKVRIQIQINNVTLS